MKSVEIFLYRLIIRLHPTEFRSRFGEEMLLDFEDALNRVGFSSLCFDGLASLGRQWLSGLFPPHPAVRRAQPSLLAGNYVELSPGVPNFTDLFRAAVLYAGFLCIVGFVFQSTDIARRQGVQNSAPTQYAGVYVSGSQAETNAQPYALKTVGRSVYPQVNQIGFNRKVKMSGDRESLGPTIFGLPLSYLELVTSFALLGWFGTYFCVIRQFTGTR